MLHRTDIIDRVKDLIRTKGLGARLGLKTIQHGDWRRLPQPDDFDAALPCVLISIKDIVFAEPIADALTAAAQQVYELTLFYVRRYPENEIVAKQDELGLDALSEIFRDLSLEDRMISPNRIMISALIRRIEESPAEFRPVEELLSDFSVTALRGEIIFISER
jgi:hypothetical protein